MHINKFKKGDKVIAISKSTLSSLDTKGIHKGEGVIKTIRHDMSCVYYDVFFPEATVKAGFTWAFREDDLVPAERQCTKIDKLFNELLECI